METTVRGYESRVKGWFRPGLGFRVGFGFWMGLGLGVGVYRGM